MKKIGLIIVGIFLSFVCLEVFLQTASFVVLEITKYRNYKTIKNKFNNNDTITILCAGESTTYEQWPVQLKQYLKENSNKNFNILTSALPAIIIEDLLEKTFEMIKEYKPDIVISMMGINDSNFKKQKESIYRKHKLKILNLFYLINKHLQSKIYAEEVKYNDLYFLELINKYKDNDDVPVEFLEILDKQPNDINPLVKLIFLYSLRNDTKNLKKYIDIYLQRHPNVIVDSVFVEAISNFCRSDEKNNYENLNNIILHLLKNKDAESSAKIDKILKNSFAYKEVDLNGLQYIYNTFIEYKLNSAVIYDIYNYLLQKNIKVKYPNYNITFSKEPNFNNKIITDSYLKLAETLEKNNIIYICMGYPTINIDMFKNMFNGTNLKDTIIFVSNEQNFNDYLKNNEYSSLFTDQFAGTFGHCTDLGNTMIAENVGNVILDITK